MQDSFPAALAAVLKHEGRYVNDADDNGGPTNMGITLATFRRFVKPGGTIADLKALTTEQAGIVYQRQYWDTVLGSQLPPGVDYATFDMSVHSGPKLSVRYLQRAVGAKADGVVGPKTLAAAAAKPAAEIINTMLDARLAFLKRHEDWRKYAKGWTSRIAGVRKLALEMARQQPTAPAPAPTQPEPETPASEPPARSIKNGIDLGRVGIALAILAALGWAGFTILT